jgi:2-keto-4-pentenoate hydratase/2-oxohepta-3-ene-1,7-dioic acid hydratase in catechol pathway
MNREARPGGSLSALTCAGLILFASFGTLGAAEPARFLRFQKGETVAYGLLEGAQVRQLSGDLFGQWSKTKTRFPLKAVKVLTPTKPTQVLAMAGNYRSHLGDEKIPPQFQIPQLFYKSPSCLIADGEPIVLPKDSEVVHSEAEMVIVIGKTCRKVPKEKALDYVFGVTAGNDVSERIWQNDPERKDVQWWRAKGADTFGPVGPCILTGVDYGNLKVTMRVSGRVVQEDKTDHLIHDVAAIISHISRYVTLHPGDLIFTGTPGKTSALKPGDIAEVELEGAGILRNSVVAEE